MAKKKHTKKGKLKEKKVPEPEVQEPEKPFDFGGLPNRDLKKNLGCG